MKKLIAIMMMLVTVVSLSAQEEYRPYERKDVTFQNVKVMNAQGEVSHVKVSAYAGRQLIKEQTFELEPAMPAEMAESIGNVSEEDINFDGYPDADFYLGYMGGFANNTQHEAWLWDQEHCRFIEAVGYGGIGEPMLDTEKKYIFTVLSSGPEHRVTSFDRWQGNRLQKYLSHTWSIEGDDLTDFSGVLNLPCCRIDAQLDGRIPVFIVFQTTSDHIVAGYIYYPKAKHPAPILIAGTVGRFDDKLYYALDEYQADGTISGTIRMNTPNNPDYFSDMEGTWTNPKTQKEMKLTSMRFSNEMPTWFTQSLLTPEDPGNIGREYSFQQWHPGYESMMGGNITFRAAGKNKVHFECANVRHNIADGKSSEGRPAVLNGTTFEYREVNECHYGFRATFFPRFVVLTTITQNPTLDCFGMGASFDGIYIKVKQ